MFWFRFLILLYPPSFRRDYADEMTCVFEQLRAFAQSAQSASTANRLRFLALILRDFASTWTRAWSSTIRPRTSRHTFSPGESVDRLTLDLRYAIRTLWTRPGFTAIIVITLSLGIGANTSIFTVVNEILLRPLPLGNPEGLVDLWAEAPGNNSFTGFSHPNFVDYRDRNDVLEGLAAFMGTSLNLGPDPGHQPISAQFTTANYFDVLGVTPTMGRAFRLEEGLLGAGSTVAIVSHGYWQRRAGGDPSFLGTTILLHGVSFTVVGIAPEGFTGTFIGFPIEVWLPMPSAEIVLTNSDLTDRTARNLEFVGRLAPGVSVAQAHAAFGVLSEALEAEHPVANRGQRIGIAPTTGVDHSMRGGVVGFLAVLMSVTSLVLLITCLNVGGMLLARATSRHREMAIRVALGARRGRVVRQLLTESLVLFGVGAVGGAFVADRVTALLRGLVESLQLPIGFTLALDWRVLGFTAAVALLTAVITGLVPARYAMRTDPIATLRTAGPEGGGRAGRLRNAFVVTQVAGACLLLIAAGLFVRSLRNGLSLDPGFEADRVAAATIALPDGKYGPERGALFFAQLLERVTGLAGVESAAIAGRAPVGVRRNPLEIEVPGYQPPPGLEVILVDGNTVSGDYFGTVDIPIIAGRVFRSADTDGSRVAIVNRTMAQRFWPDENPVGQTFTASGASVSVVGIAANSRYLIQDDSPVSLAYFPSDQSFSPQMLLLVRSTGDPLAIQDLLQREIAGLDPDLPAVQLVTLRETINVSLLPQRVAASVTAGLGVFGVFLAALGVYGILAHVVGQRTREIGIRLALGSQPVAVLAMVVGAGMRLVGGGVVLGTVVALAATPLLRSFLVGVGPGDPVTVLSVAGVFVLVALVASWVPARRAVGVDAAVTLRGE